MISIGTIGLIKAVSSFDASKGARLATYAARCVENEILMYFRSQRKSAQDVSLSDYIETGTDGAELSLMDVVSEDVDLLEQITTQENVQLLRNLIKTCLTEQEQQACVAFSRLTRASIERHKHNKQDSRNYGLKHKGC